MNLSGAMLLCWSLQQGHSLLKSGGDKERREWIGREQKSSIREITVAMRQLSLIRQSSLIKLCAELPLLLVLCTQAVV